MASSTLPSTVNIAALLMMAYIIIFPIYYQSQISQNLQTINSVIIIGGAFFKAIPIILLSTMVAGRDKIVSKNDKLLSFINSISYGLLFSSIGDISLDIEDLPNYKFLFIVGLGSFLIAHLIYIRGFFIWGLQHSAVVAIAVGAGPLGMLSLLIPALQKKPETSELLIPVCIYTLTIAVMVYTACIRNDEASAVKNSIVSLSKRFGIYGAIVFAISDSILAYDKFILPINNGKIYVMVTYYLAQICIALSAYYSGNSNDETTTTTTNSSSTSNSSSGKKDSKKRK